MRSSVQLGGVGERVVRRDRQADRQRHNSNCLLCIGHRPLYKRKGLREGRGGGHIVKQAKQRNKGQGRGGGEKGGGGDRQSHTLRNTHFCTSVMSFIATLTIKKLFSFVCGMKNKF